MNDVMTSPAVVRKAIAALMKLAKAINRGHAAVLSLAGKSLEHARATGELLIQAKEALPHGEFGPWLAEHCQVRERQASRYMLIARHWQRLKSDARVRFDELSLRKFLDLLVGDQAATVLEAWETPSSEPVCDVARHIDTLLESLPPAEQCEVLERNADRLEERERADAEKEGRDDRSRRIKSGEAQIGKARRQYLGLGHEADAVVGDLDAAARGSAELGSG